MTELCSDGDLTLNPKTRHYTTVTEVPGIGATKEQVERIYHRYHVASQYCQGKRVLEVACGAGLGLGYLARTASRVVGGDYTGVLVGMARNHYCGNLDLLRLDGHALPFKDASFDTVVLLEAIYYLDDPGQFLRECRRLLSKGGVLVLCTVNKDWADFNPSPFSTRYYSAAELFTLLVEHGFDADMYGAFHVTVDSLPQKMNSLIKRTAVSLNLMPRSMKGKEFLKRVFYGRLTPLPSELAWGQIEETSLIPISEESPTSEFKILYAVGRPHRR